MSESQPVKGNDFEFSADLVSEDFFGKLDEIVLKIREAKDSGTPTIEVLANAALALMNFAAETNVAVHNLDPEASPTQDPALHRLGLRLPGDSLAYKKRPV